MKAAAQAGRSCRPWPSPAACAAPCRVLPRSRVRASNSAAGNCEFTGRGNLGAPPKPPSRESKLRRKTLKAAFEHLSSSRRSVEVPRHRRASSKLLDHIVRRIRRFWRDRCSRRWRCDASTVWKARAPVAVSGGKYVPPKNGFRSGVSHTDIGHPPAAGCGLHEGHVDAIDVGPLLAIDLDGDKVSVQHRRRSRRFRMTRAPSRGTSGRSSSRWKGRSACPRAAPFERLFAPRMPVHWIVRVLEQIGTLLAR